MKIVIFSVAFKKTKENVNPILYSAEWKLFMLVKIDTAAALRETIFQHYSLVIKQTDRRCIAY